MTQSLRILHTESAMGLGGQEIYILRQMLAMRERGHHLALLGQPGSRVVAAAQAAGFDVFERKMGGLGRLVTGAMHVAGLVRRQRFDVVNTTSRRDSLIAAIGARFGGTPLIVRSRHLMSPVNSLLTFVTLPHRVITVSRFVGQLLIDAGVPASRIGIVPPIPGERSWKHADADVEWARLQRERLQVRRDWGVDDGDTVIGCVAVLREPKGHRELIDAFALICRDRTDVQLKIVGDGKMMVPLRQQVDALGLGGRVQFLGYRENAAHLMAGMDIFALATHKEASGTVYLEAAEAALPIVTTRVGGVPEMLLDGGNAVLVPSGDAAALSSALHEVVSDIARRRDMGKLGWEWMRANPLFTPEGHAKATEALYFKWLEERGHG